MSVLDIPQHEPVYQERMAAIADVKAALLCHAPTGAIVLDYGCGAGDVIASASRMRPDLRFIGFDAQPSAVAAAAAKRIPRAAFFVSEAEAFAAVRASGHPGVLFLSSVIHEIASVYGPAGLVRVLGQADGFEMAIVRDMAHARAAEALSDRVPDRLCGTRWAREIAAKWGPLDTAPAVAHLMLKARYTDNWDAELLENYFSYSKEGLIEAFAPAFPRVLSLSHTVPEFLADEFRRDYGRGPLTPTHIEVVLGR